MALERRHSSRAGDPLDFDYIVSGIMAPDPHPLLDMVDGHAQQYQPPDAAAIAPEQKAALVAQQPPRLVNLIAYFQRTISRPRS